MKTKYIFLLLILGTVLGLVGSLIKIQHWQGAEFLIILAIILNICFWILLVWKAFTHPALRDFMNK
jgi:hypothetical protein